MRPLVKRTGFFQSDLRERQMNQRFMQDSAAFDYFDTIVNASEVNMLRKIDLVLFAAAFLWVSSGLGLGLIG